MGPGGRETLPRHPRRERQEKLREEPAAPSLRASLSRRNPAPGAARGRRRRRRRVACAPAPLGAKSAIPRLWQERTPSSARRTISATRPKTALSGVYARRLRVPARTHSRLRAPLPRPGPSACDAPDPPPRAGARGSSAASLRLRSPPLPLPRPPPPVLLAVASAPPDLPWSRAAGRARRAEQVRASPSHAAAGPEVVAAPGALRAPLLRAALGLWRARGHVGGDGQQRGGRWGRRRRRRAGFLSESPGRRRRQPGLEQWLRLLPGGLGAGGHGDSGGAGSAAAAAATPPAGKSDSEIRSQGASEAARAGGVDRGAAGSAVWLRGT